MLSPMSSQVEKSILEIQAIHDNAELAFSDICNLLQIPDWLNDDIRLACMLKIREISSGSDCLVKYKCPKCNSYTESQILLEKMLDFSLWGQVKKFQDVKLKEGVSLNEVQHCSILQSLQYVEDCPSFTQVSDITDLALSLKARIPKLVQSKTCKCLFCGFESLVNINKQFVLNSMSEYSISSMYQAYHKLVINGFTKLDVDSMLPFERDVQLGLIDKMIEDMRKRNNPKPQQ